MERPSYKLVDRSAKLLQTVLQEDLDAFTTILSEAKPDEINKFHGFPHETTALMAAIQRGHLHFIQPLLDAGAEVNDLNVARKMSCIHLAVRSSRPEILELLLRFGANVNIRDGSGKTALHILISQWTKDGLEDTRWPYFDLLISHPATDINAQDNDEITPLELAVRKSLLNVVRKLLQAGATLTQHVREAMEEHMPELLAELPAEEQGGAATNNNPVADMTVDNIEADLWRALRGGNLERFQLLLETIAIGGVGSSVNLSTSTSSHNPTLLQYACEWQVVPAVASLLTAGVDPNQTSFNNSTPPLLLTAIKGNVDILRLLVNSPHIQLDAIDHVGSGQTALHKIAQKLHDASVEDRLRYGQCLHLLLSKSQQQTGSNGADDQGIGGPSSININCQDSFGNSPLHYAALSGVESAVVQLLRSGAHLGLKNHLEETAVKRILPSTLESFLDSCIRLSDEESSSQNFSITFDYSLLATPRPPPTTAQHLQPSETGVTFNNHNDAVETINLQAATPEQDKIYPECEALWHLSRSSRHQYLLKHPVLSSFLMLKWKNISKFYYVNVLVYSLTVLVLSTYILLLNSGYDSDSYRVSLSVLWYCLIFFVTILFLREFFQLGIAPLRYLFSLENYIELIMLGCTCTVLANWKEPNSWRPFSAMAVLLAWAEGLLLLGRHPKLSIFVTMFTTVSKTFLRLLLWYSVLLIGFGLSFFLIFGNTTGVDESKADSDNKDAFANIPASLLKVSAMMTGELEFGDLPFDAHPFTSRLIFIAFLFLITIVLLNLLNGMAVSDTQAIQSKAETIGYVSRVELISYMESMLLGDPFNFLADWPPFALLRRHCPSTSPLSNLMRVDTLRRFMRTEDTVLFYQCLPYKMFTIYPQRKLNQVSPGDHLSQQQNKMCSCHVKFRLDEQILQTAIQRAQDYSNRSAAATQQEATNAHILAEMDRLHSAVLLLQNQNSKLLQLLQSSHHQST